MKTAPTEMSGLHTPRRLIRRATRGGRADSRVRRYVIAALFCIIVVWGTVAAYMFLLPKSYTSTFVMVLPGAGASSAVNIESIGSASSTAASAFSSPDLSPTENYRKFLLSHRLLGDAARVSGDDPDHFPLPRVDLADQTKLITISITGRTPEQATQRAEAIRSVFRDTLDDLRKDEIAQRDTTYKRILSGYQTRLQEARQKLIDQQARTGLVSIEQYGTIVSGVERVRDEARGIEAKLAQGRSGVAELSRLLGLSPEQASTAMVLRADPLFQSLLETLAKQDTEIASRSGTHGTANPKLVDDQAERDSVLAKLVERGNALSGLKRAELLKLRDVSLRDERARLFERLLGQVSDIAAMSAELKELNSQLEREQQRVIRLADDASHLDNLRRDVQVAEAVFTSALARIDTSKSDYFASYPMLQTFEAPLTPAKPSSPSPVLAVAGGLGATFLIIAALVLSWLRIELFQKILKSA